MAETLKRLGADCVVSPGIPSIFYPLVYSHNLSILKLPFYLLAFLKRRLQFRSIKRRFDAVVVQKQVLPHFPPWFEKKLAAAGIPFVFDFDDGNRVMFHLSQAGRVDIESPQKKTRPKGAVVRFRFATIDGETFLRRVARLLD